MEKRQDKYDDNNSSRKMSRTERHQALYNEINSKIGYGDVSSYEPGTKIDLSTINMDRPNREEYKKIKEYKNIMDNEDDSHDIEIKREPAKVKSFDINAALEEAKKNRKNEDELEKKRKLSDSDSVLSSLNKKYLHTKDFSEEDDGELKELIDTITTKTMIDDIKDEDEKELLSELLATTIDIKLEQELSNDEINKLYSSDEEENTNVELTDEYEELNTDTDITDKLDNSFFTHSVELKKDDLITDDNYDEDEEDEEGSNHSLIKIIAVVLVILALVLLVTYFVLKQIGFSI